MMAFDKSVPEQSVGTPVQLPPVDPTVAALATVQRQLAEQANLLRAMNDELAALRAAQATYSDTVARLERQLRWARWGRRLRGTIFALFWLGVIAIIAYYWGDVSQIWNEWSRFIL